MKSRITIEVDYENNRLPEIKIIYLSSDDVRDGMIKDFTQILGHESSWLKILFSPFPLPEGIGQIIHIRPIPPEKLKEEGEIMIEQYRVREKWLK